MRLNASEKKQQKRNVGAAIRKKPAKVQLVAVIYIVLLRLLYVMSQQLIALEL